MQMNVASRIMARTTLDIDTPLLRDLKRLQRKEKKSLGRLVSDLLVQALALHRSARPDARAFAWTSQDMKARVDIGDRDAVYEALDEKGS